MRQRVVRQRGRAGRLRQRVVRQRVRAGRLRQRVVRQGGGWEIDTEGGKAERDGWVV